MRLEIEIPDTLGEPLAKHFGDLSRKALESLAVEGYKSGVLSEFEVRKLLGHTTRWETDGFLKEHEAWLPITVEEVAREVESFHEVAGQ